MKIEVNKLKILRNLETEYEEMKQRANDPYIEATYYVAERWADLMEKYIIYHTHFRKTLRVTILVIDEMASIAIAAYHDAEIEGLTGLMLKPATDVLYKYWVYGEILKKALRWAATHEVKKIDYKTRLIDIEKRVLKSKHDNKPNLVEFSKYLMQS